MNHPIHFVSLGPGDPELITLKGLKTLQKLISFSGRRIKREPGENPGQTTLL